MNRKRFWMMLPPVAMCLIDQAFTLLGQDPKYWQGDYSLAKEGNPLFRRILETHPLLFEGGVLAWMLFFCVVIYLLPRRLAMVGAIATAVGHTWGASTWILWLSSQATLASMARSIAHDAGAWETFLSTHGYWLTFPLFILAGALITLAVEKSGKSPMPDGQT